MLPSSVRWGDVSLLGGVALGLATLGGCHNERIPNGYKAGQQTLAAYVQGQQLQLLAVPVQHVSASS